MSPNHQPLAQPSLILVLENIRSVHNVGALLRTADGMGNIAVWTIGYTPRPDHERVQKTALGAEKAVKWEYHPTTRMACESLKQSGYTIWALEITEDSNPLPSLTQRPEKLALILGHEVDGVSDEALSYCEQAVHIPMQGIKESLNVSIAGGIAMYALIYQAQ